LKKKFQTHKFQRVVICLMRSPKVLNSMKKTRHAWYHRDLKPENLLVMRRKDDKISIKLADFGLAMEVKHPIFTVCGTPTYVGK